MSAPSYYLIAGATGRQGGSVVKALLGSPGLDVQPKQVYAVTRDGAGSGANRLRQNYNGINIVTGDLNNPTALFQQLPNNILPLTAVYLAQAHGPTELDDAKGFIDAAAANNVPYFVYSSVDRGGRELSDKDPSYCKTFSDKFYIEQHLRAVSDKNASTPHKMDYTIIRPTWFTDNAWWAFPGKLCMTGWRENMKGKKMQITTIKDIGRWAAEGLVRPDRTGIRNEALSIASDELSFNEIDAKFVNHTGAGVPVTYGLLARLMIWMVKDLNTMFSFIGERDYGADLNWLKTQLEPTTFDKWLAETVPAKSV